MRKPEVVSQILIVLSLEQEIKNSPLGLRYSTGETS